jgi:hypothetical protein
MKSRTLSFALAIIALVPTAFAAPIMPSDNAQEEIQEALILAEDGDVIELGAGIFHLKSTLSLDIDNVTVQGAGIDRTILSFKGQDAGSEGF